nr:alpha/beta fold hydrolase [Brucella anthropi]
MAPLLAKHFTVVCPDLRGFGKSQKTADAYDYEAAFKRAKARDCVALMKYLGYVFLISRAMTEAATPPFEPRWINHKRPGSLLYWTEFQFWKR